MRCEAARYPEPRYTLYYNCRAPFIVQPGLIRCRSCRLRRLTVVQPLSDFSQSAGVSFDPTLNKSQIIKALVAAMDLIHRKDEVILMAPTGAAPDVMGGSTYHTSLGISLNRYRRGGSKVSVGTIIRLSFPIISFPEAGASDKAEHWR